MAVCGLTARSILCVSQTILAVCFTLQMVAIASPHWFLIKNYSDSIQTNVYRHVGFFQICTSGICVSHSSGMSHMDINHNSVGYVILLTLGALLQLGAFVIGILCCGNKDQRISFLVVAVICFAAAGCIVGGILSFFYSIIIRSNMHDFLEALLKTAEIKMGWSFDICCISAIITIILATALIIIAFNKQRMPIKQHQITFTETSMPQYPLSIGPKQLQTYSQHGNGQQISRIEQQGKEIYDDDLHHVIHTLF